MQIPDNRFKEEPVWVVKYNSYQAPSKRRAKKRKHKSDKAKGQ